MCRCHARVLVAGAVGTLLSAAAIVATAQPEYDLVIIGGRLVDGSGSAARRADVAITAGRVAAIGTFRAADGRAAIDARGLVVAPGFIDVHTHADDLAEQPRAENFVRMGVTTVVAGNCGASPVDVGEALAAVEGSGPSVNFATLVGHNAVRTAVMGTANRPPTLPELNKMRSLVWRGMADGAVGLSFGLQYVPGTYAASPELIVLARVAGNASGVCAWHLRNEGTALQGALEEALRVSETGSCRAQISHLKVDSPSHWGNSAKALNLIDGARTRGVEVNADQYAYTAASSTLGIRFPSWALEGGSEQIAARLSEGSTWERIKREMKGMLAERGFEDLSFAVIASYRADPTLNGLSMKQAALRLRAADSADAQLETARHMMLNGGAAMVYHLMSDGDVERIMRHPFVGFASDSGLLRPGEGVPHPRGYGNAARVLGNYSRGRKVLPLEEAIRKMTSLPAEHFRLTARGRLKQGYAADAIVFDPATVADLATFERPHAYAAGVRHVLVNGVAVVRDGVHTGARAGQVIARRSLAAIDAAGGAGSRLLAREGVVEQEGGQQH